MKDVTLESSGASSETKKLIADAAAHEIMAKGYAGASLSVIANRLGLTKGALTYQFPTKAAFAHYFIDVTREATRQANTFATSQYPDCGARQLLLYFRLVNSWWESDVQVAAGLALFTDHASPASESADVIQDWLALSVESLQVCYAQGQLTEGLTATDAAEMFLMTNLGATFFSHHVRMAPSWISRLRFCCLALTAVGVPQSEAHLDEVITLYANNLPAPEHF